MSVSACIFLQCTSVHKGRGGGFILSVSLNACVSVCFVCVSSRVQPLLRQMGRQSESSSQLSIILSLRNSAD